MSSINKSALHVPASTSRLQRFAGAIATLFILGNFAIPGALSVVFGPVGVLRVIAFEIAMFAVLIAFILPILLNRLPNFRLFVKPLWLRWSILACVAGVFIYPAARISLVALHLVVTAN